jgi:hypothetical protein
MNRDELRQQMAVKVGSVYDSSCTMHVTEVADAVYWPEIERLRYERRLLGFARMTLDLVAAGDPDRWKQARREAEDIAERIVDEVGHPATDEPALGPSFRAQLEQVQAALARWDNLTRWDSDDAIEFAEEIRTALEKEEEEDLPSSGGAS